MAGVKEWKPLILVLSHMPLQLNAVAEHAWSIYHAIVMPNSHSHLPKCKIWALRF
jgi:hypothetical protein